MAVFIQHSSQASNISDYTARLSPLINVHFMIMGNYLSSELITHISENYLSAGKREYNQERKVDDLTGGDWTS